VLLVPFPGQPREGEKLKFPLHYKSGWKKKTCIDSGILDNNCSAAKDVGGMTELLGSSLFFLGEIQKALLKGKSIITYSSHLAHLIPHRVLTSLSPRLKGPPLCSPLFQ
jgi:hypothetical protein